MQNWHATHAELEVIVSGSPVLFATPDRQEIFRAAGWDFNVQPDG
jgi:hypothetical protein